MKRAQQQLRMRKLGTVAPLTIAIALFGAISGSMVMGQMPGRAEEPHNIQQLDVRQDIPENVRDNVQQLLTTGHCQGCDLSGADLAQTHLIGADLRDANLQGANLTESNLEGADLTGANLSDANLTGALLSNAVLNNSILNRVNFTNAKLYGIIAAGAEMEDLILTGAEILDTTPGIGGDRGQFDNNAIDAQ